MPQNNLAIQPGSFTYSFSTSKSAEAVFRLLLDVEQWWSGLHGEIIKGKSRQVGDTFSFEAGGGAHYSNQKLTELVAAKTVVWAVTDSRLTFLDDTSEWKGTKLRFDISSDGNATRVTFTHDGLVPEIECYNDCSTVWPKYLHKLEQKLQ